MNLNQRRRLSNVEREAWLYGSVHACNYCYCARVEGILPFEKIHQATQSLREFHPITAAKIEVDCDLAPYFSTEGVPNYPIEIIEGNHANDWKSIFSRELNTKFDTSKGPLLRICILNCENFTDIILVCHHICSDGVSAGFFAHDLLTLLDGGTLHPRAGNRILPPATELVKESAWPGLRNQCLPNFIPASSPQQISSSMNISSWMLPLGHIENLIHLCRSERVTLHSLICTLVVREINRYQNKDAPRILQCPVDIRSALQHDAQAAHGFFIGITCMEVELIKGTLWEQARDVHRLLTAATSAESVLGPLLDYERSLQAQSDEEILTASLATKPNYELSISNLRRISFQEDYSTFKVASVFAAVSVSAGERVLVLITSGGGMHMLLTTWFDDPFPRIIANVYSHLEAVASRTY